MLSQVLLLFAAGLFGGVLNAIAGGGSFITFPALLFVSVPPLSANATNTFASCSGYLSGAYAFRRELLIHRQAIPRILFISLAGGIIGAWLLLQTPAALFREAIPWLLLFAILLFIFGNGVNERLEQFSSRHRYASFISKILLMILLLGVCIYGGFFNAGLGIIVLSYLVLAGYSDINAMNGLKLLISAMVSLVALAIFILNDMIAWWQGIVVMLGTLAGGHFAADLSRKLPQHYVRMFVVVVGIAITVYFFIKTFR